ISITEKTGSLVAIKAVQDSDDLMIITQLGITIRVAVNKIATYRRATQGVRLINLKETDKIASVARVYRNESEEEDTNGEDVDAENNES
ncbi:MAG: DNA gyrase subunit A, partial [Mariniphaga sp.]|nr:DNA gyrase subunit A [Mariniphaga sp.]